MLRGHLILQDGFDSHTCAGAHPFSSPFTVLTSISSCRHATRSTQIGTGDRSDWISRRISASMCASCMLLITCVWRHDAWHEMGAVGIRNGWLSSMGRTAELSESERYGKEFRFGIAAESTRHETGGEEEGSDINIVTAEGKRRMDRSRWKEGIRQTASQAGLGEMTWYYQRQRLTIGIRTPTHTATVLCPACTVMLLLCLLCCSMSMLC
jgi:hypothetical protein